MVNASNSIYASALYSVFGLNQALESVATSTARLASGNRLLRAGDDVGALTQGVQLRSNIASLRQALQNSTQADSFLQTAYTGLSTINDILEEMNALAVQANSSSLTDADRAFLQVEFEELSAEVDQIAEETAFNDINLLDGTLSEENAVGTYDDNATQGQAILTFGVNIGALQTVVINNVTFTEGTDFAAGGSINASLTNLAAAINTSTNNNVTKMTASVNLNTLVLTADAGGELGNFLLVNQGASTAVFTTTGGATASATIYSFDGGDADGLTSMSVIASGTIGDPIVNTQSQTQSEIRLVTTGNFSNAETFSVDDSNGGLTAFTFLNAPAASTDVQIGSSIEETLQNLIDTIGNYTGTTRYTLDQLDFIRDGDQLIIRSKDVGDPTDLAFAAFNFAEGTANGSLTSATLNSGTTTGINTSGVTNEDFIGTISGFTATYNSADNVTAQITVGDYTYRATITDTTPAVATTYRFTSTTSGGGYFDVELSTTGQAVANQTDANTYAAQIDAAIGGLTFSQNRIAESFTGVGDLIGGSFEFQLDDFDSVDLESITVTAPPASGLSATLEFVVNGETFRSSTSLGDTISEYEIVDFQSTTTSNKLRLRMGNNEADLSTVAGAEAFEADLEESFGIDQDNTGVTFQIGASTSNLLSVTIGSATTDKLFAGQSINISTQSAAATAETVLDDAIDEVTELLSAVGSYQAVNNYAADGLTSEILAKEEARAALEDTDVAEESTALALATVQAQTSAAVLAQTLALSGTLLTLLEATS